MGLDPVPPEDGDWLDGLLRRAFPRPADEVTQDELDRSYERLCGVVDRARTDPALRADLDAIAAQTLDILGEAASIVDEARGDR